MDTVIILNGIERGLSVREKEIQACVVFGAMYCMHTLAVSQKACNDGPINENFRLQFSSISHFFRRLAGAEFTRIFTLLETRT